MDWTNVAPRVCDGFERVRGLLRSQGVDVQVHCIEKSPRMTDYVVPTGVSVDDAGSRAARPHLGYGTPVMHEGFVDFNAGTLGTSMIEGRVGAGGEAGFCVTADTDCLQGDGRVAKARELAGPRRPPVPAQQRERRGRGRARRRKTGSRLTSELHKN